MDIKQLQKAVDIIQEFIDSQPVATDKPVKITKSREFMDVFNSYLAMRVSIKKKATPRAQNLILGQLEKFYPWNEKLQIMCLEKSILNNRQWVFPLDVKDVDIYKKKRIPIITQKPIEIEKEQKFVPISQEQLDQMNKIKANLFK